jgi:2'-5' RNA ligase
LQSGGRVASEEARLDGTTSRADTLAETLQSTLVAGGLYPDLESPRSVGYNSHQTFRPHVTLARKVHRAPRVTKMEPVIWTCNDFVLVDSKTLPEGSVYTVLERFSF